MSFLLNPHIALALTVTLNGRTITHTATTPDNATAAIQLRSDGVLLITDATGTLTVVAGLEWLDPEGAANAANFEAMAEMTSGTLSSGTENTWEDLSTTRTYQKIRTNNAEGVETCEFNLKIRHKFTLAVVSAPIVLEAEVTL